jgi:hypothetical protein
VRCYFWQIELAEESAAFRVPSQRFSACASMAFRALDRVCGITAFDYHIQCAEHIANILKDKEESGDSTMHAGNTSFRSIKRWAHEIIGAEVS